MQSRNRRMHKYESINEIKVDLCKQILYEWKRQGWEERRNNHLFFEKYACIVALHLTTRLIAVTFIVFSIAFRRFRPPLKQVVLKLTHTFWYVFSIFSLPFFILSGKHVCIVHSVRDNNGYFLLHKMHISANFFMM